MGLEFTAILSGNSTASIGDLALSARAAFAAAGFSGGRVLLRCAYDHDRDVYDEESPDQEFELEDGRSGPPYEWDGWATEYVSDGDSFYVIVGRNPRDGSVNAWMDLSQRALADLWQDGRFALYLSAVTALARAISATAGYGHGSLDFHLLAQADAVASIDSMPEYPGESSSLGIVLPDACKGADPKDRWGKQFDVMRSTTGYVLLIHKDFEARYG